MLPGETGKRGSDMANYCTLEAMKSLLPPSMTVGETTQDQPTLQAPSGKESYTPKAARKYVRLASQQIDSRLSPVYQAPLKRIKIHETELVGSVSKGGTIIRVHDHGPFTVDSFLRISDDRTTDLYTVEDIGDDPAVMGQITISPSAVRDYTPGHNPLVSLLEYPDPIPFICARLAVAIMIDRIFVAEQSPDVSHYGENLRSQAGTDIDLILSGQIRLHGQTHHGSRFGRYSIMNAVRLPGVEHRPGEMKS